MTGEVLMLFAAALIVFFAAVIFCNAIEFIGGRMRWSGSFVGAIIAPLFTSIPELTVFLVAVFVYDGAAGEKIGIGTLFGQPFMASSLSYGMVGLVVVVSYLLGKRSTKTMEVEKALFMPYTFIVIFFPVTLIPSFFESYLVRLGFAAIFLGAYIYYVFLMYRKRSEETLEEIETVHITRFIKHPFLGAIVQLGVSLALLYYGSGFLVYSVDHISMEIGVSSLGLALIIIPAATAIPETISALIWGFRGKDTLSIGALVGEKILYSTFYPCLGLILIPWRLDIYAFESVLVTTVISAVLLYFIWRRKIPYWALCTGIFFFIAYAYFLLGLHV